MNAQSTTGVYVIALADKSGIRYHPTPEDALAAIATRLAGDEMVDLLGRYLAETHQG